MSKFIQNIKSLLIVTVIMFFVNNNINSQETVVLTDTVKASWRPIIGESSRININPDIVKETDLVKTDVSYSILKKEQYVPYNIIPINPAKIKGEPLTKLYKSYAKIGVGTRKSFMGEYYINSIYSRDYTWGGYVKYRSSNGEIKNYDNTKYTDLNGSFYYKRIFSKNTLYGRVYCNSNFFNYYGYDANVFTNMEKDDIKQYYIKPGLSLSYYNNEIDSNAINKKIGLSYKYISDYYKSQEHIISLKSTFDKYMNKEKVSLDFNTDIYQHSMLLADSLSALIEATPYIKSEYQNLKFKVGLRLNSEIQGKANIIAYPNIDIKYSVFNNYLTFYIGIDGQTERNSLDALSNYNPYFNLLNYYAFKHVKKNAYGGIKAVIAKGLYVNLSGEYKNIENLALFTLDSNVTSRNLFNIIYDEADLVKVNGEIMYNKGDNLKIILSGNFYNYTTAIEEKPWGYHDLDITLTSNYVFKDKIVLKGDVFYIGNQYIKYPNLTNEPSMVVGGNKLKNTVDFNLGLEYKYTKLLSAWVDFYNIASQKYYRFNNYPVYGFTVMGGLTYCF